MITKKQVNAINSYFNKKGMDRKQLEEVLNFDKLTMESQYAHDILRMLQSDKEIEPLVEYEEDENVIKGYVRFVKNRSGSGNITWDEFIAKLKDLYLEESPFGIRIQRFCKNAYWEIFFNHFDIEKCEDDENEKITFNQFWYHDTEIDNACSTLDEHGIDTELETKEVLSQVADKWNGLEDDDKDDVIAALYTLYSTQYVEKSRVMILKKDIKEIWMSNADLVPEVGLRDYHIKFNDGDDISLRF